MLTACPRHSPLHISRNGPSFSPSSVSQNVPQPLSVRHACNCHIVHTSTHTYWPFGCIHNPTATCCCCACLVFFVFVVFLFFFVALFNRLHILVHEHFSSHFCGVSVAHSFHRCQLLSVISNCCWRWQRIFFYILWSVNCCCWSLALTVRRHTHTGICILVMCRYVATCQRQP